MNPLTLCLGVSALLFCLGLAAALSRSGAIFVLLGIELMLNAANLNLVAFWRYGPTASSAEPLLFVLFSIAVAAAEAAVGLALVIAIHRRLSHSKLSGASQLKG
ncbi:NADH-quinone oxidoreductase subunit NuoK [Nibricoccus sp. IMCC34717]|uniref:NADH-quinone oxidoreductase subunit NuoK n=1 Tax=Nibricoccus sp. IMCC34717 TaxID=3034021 RepID=UPI0038508356